MPTMMNFLIMITLESLLSLVPNVFVIVISRKKMTKGSETNEIRKKAL